VQERLPPLFPFEPTRCRSHYRLLSRQSSNGALGCVLQVAACDLEALNRDLAAFWRIGWIPSFACPTALSLGALLSAQGPLAEKEPVLVVELGAGHSTLAIAANRQIVFARDVALGSDYLTEALTCQVMVGRESLQLSWEQAERLKCEVGIPEADSTVQPLEGRLPLQRYHAMLQPALEQWLGEIQRTMAFGIQSLPEAVPQTVLLCGGGSQLAGLERWLSQQLGLPVESLTLQPILGEDLPAFAVTCGLLVVEGASRQPLRPSSAPRLTVGPGLQPPRPCPPCVSRGRRGEDGAEPLAGVNLLPEKTLKTRRLIRAARITIKGLIVAVMGVWLGIGAMALKLRPAQGQLATLEQRWKRLEPVTALAEAVATHATLLETLSGTQGVSAQWLKRLAEDFPHPVRLTELSISAGGEVRAAGQAQAREQSPEAYVSELAIWLEQVGLCQDVRLGSTQRKPHDPELVDFSLTCQRQNSDQ
jgi:hypothetical protein